MPDDRQATRGDAMKRGHDDVDTYHRILLDAIPASLFVVDDDVRIHDFNDAAEAVFRLYPSKVLNRRGGEVLHCLHATDVPEGCGRGPFCKDCVIRNAVTESLRGHRVTRQRARLVLATGGERKELDLLITASPLLYRGEPRSLLILEDISEVFKLRDIIPICARCKRIRDDQEFWASVEDYFSTYIGVDFSHGICPACRSELYPGIGEHSEGDG